jgi:uncharacterized damage-inducible protein DinB
MNLFHRLAEHNAWANGMLIDGIRKHAAFATATDVAGTSLVERLKHMAEVEEAFALLLKGAPDWPKSPDTVEGLLGYLHLQDTALIEFGRTLTAAGLAKAVPVPWWGNTEVLAEDCFVQVVAHSDQHRSELCWELLRAGIDTGEKDYIRWVVKRQP